VLPGELEPAVLRELGAAPAEAGPNGPSGPNPRHRWVIDALLRFGFDRLEADAAILWLSDPDGAAHEHGIGSDEAAAALATVDAELHRLLEELRRRGLEVDVFVTSDHGFSTHLGGFDLDRAVTEVWSPGQGIPPVVAGGAVYLRDQRSDLLAELVARLQASAWAGAIFSPARAPGDAFGVIPGTLSFDLIGWRHPRSADLLVSASWSAAQNERGWAGTTTQGGVAGHGTSSPFDIHNTLIATGPDLRTGVVLELPTSNIDLAPTICRLLGVAAPPSMTGRVLEEALREGSESPAPRVEELRVETAVPGYRLTASFSQVGAHRYFDGTEVVRSPSP
jgi:arylsulfatase A-like enzyme